MHDGLARCLKTLPTFSRPPVSGTSTHLSPFQPHSLRFASRQGEHPSKLCDDSISRRTWKTPPHLLTIDTRSSRTLVPLRRLTMG